MFNLCILSCYLTNYFCFFPILKYLYGVLPHSQDNFWIITKYTDKSVKNVLKKSKHIHINNKILHFILSNIASIINVQFHIEDLCRI